MLQTSVIARPTIRLSHRIGDGGDHISYGYKNSDLRIKP